jgi:cytoplasmic iron level regulating protein YaaA (DUF328/UPF0246 family)
MVARGYQAHTAMSLSYIITMSPAKRFHEPAVEVPRVSCTSPQFLHEADYLVQYLKSLDSDAIAKMMSLSQSLAELNHQRYQSYRNNVTHTEQVAAAFFSGDAYQSLSFNTIPPEAAKRAQDRLLFLSGLYGFLKPYDFMQPYRLEMGCKTQSVLGHSLYDYWLPRLAPAINELAISIAADYHFNLASSEYGKAIDCTKLNVPTIDFVFAKPKADTYRVIGVMAKRARGSMARYLLTHDIQSLEDVRNFNLGYRFSAQHSNDRKFVFLESN